MQEVKVTMDLEMFADMVAQAREQRKEYQLGHEGGQLIAVTPDVPFVGAVEITVWDA